VTLRDCLSSPQMDRPELTVATFVCNLLVIKVSSFGRVLRIDHFRNLLDFRAEFGSKSEVTEKHRLKCLVISGRKAGVSGSLWGARLVVTLLVPRCFCS
jgi:hypothetical protein